MLRFVLGAIAGLLLAVPFFALAQTNRTETMNADRFGAWQDVVDSLARDTAALSTMVSGVNNASLRGRMLENLQRLTLGVDALRDFESEALQPCIELSDSGAVGEPLSTQDVQQILVALRGESFTEDRLSLLETVIQGRTLTVAQAAHVVRAFSLDDEKAAAILALVPRLTDTGQVHRLLAQLNHETTRIQVRDEIDLMLADSAS